MGKLVFTGGRDYRDVAHVERTLLELRPPGVEVYVGDCPTGVDKFVRDACLSREIPYKVFKADWDKHGRAAGPIRNREMLEAADAEKGTLVVAFPGGRGTADCVRQAKAFGMKVLSETASDDRSKDG